MDLTISNQLEAGNKNNVVREYRKGNWTVEETMVLIEAKKMDDERRILKRSISSSSDYQRGKQAELRWKWIEDYCWKNECFRSQNQCNDKWDNLMRDYKKVREYERRVRDQDKSYWKIDKNQRRDNSLPSNMLLQIYEALVEAVDRKDKTVAVVTTCGPPAATSIINIDNIVCPVVLKKSVGALVQHSIPPPPVLQQQQQQQHPHQAQALLPAPLPPPVRTPAVQPAPPTIPFSPPLPTVDSDTSEYSDSPAKRRKRRDTEAGGGGGEGTSGGGASSSSTLMGEVGWAISKSASMMAKAIQSREEREERRHGEVLRLHERRLQIEESKAEINRQGINNLTEAINKLATSILALAAHKNQPP